MSENVPWHVRPAKIQISLCISADQNLHWCIFDSQACKVSSCRQRRPIRLRECTCWFESSLGVHQKVRFLMLRLIQFWDTSLSSFHPTLGYQNTMYCGVTQYFPGFLAHLSDCSGWASVITLSPLSLVHRRLSTIGAQLFKTNNVVS